MLHGIADWNAVYNNAENIPDGRAWPQRWLDAAEAFRAAFPASRARLELAYGTGGRNKFDLFLPEGAPRGLVVYVHGGFWMSLDRSHWSHLAAGPLARGYAVAFPEYTLCPQTSLSGITAEIGLAIAVIASEVAGPIRLIGHSAGGHLVSRMASHTSPLPEDVRARVERVVSVSGLHDLRPLKHVWRQETLRISDAEMLSESPALLHPLPGTEIICWVGARETSEFIRQSELLANIWKGLGARTDSVLEPDRHHFNIADGLMEPDHELTKALLG